MRWDIVGEILKMLIVIAVCAWTLILSFGCASSGLYQMSDEWCGRHPAADSSRCGKRSDDCATHPSGWCKK